MASFNPPAVWANILNKPSGLLTLQYTSGAQTITSLGLLTLAHGLGVVPKCFDYQLVCQTAELGYSVGDVAELVMGYTSGGNQGLSVVADATNIVVRYGASSPSCFFLIHKTTGVLTSITHSSWKLVVRAFS